MIVKLEMSMGNDCTVKSSEAYAQLKSYLNDFMVADSNTGDEFEPDEMTIILLAGGA